MSRFWKNVSDERAGDRDRASLHRRLAPGGLIRKVWVARLRPFSIATLVIYGTMSCEPWNYALAQQAPRAATTSAQGRSLAQFDRSIRGARDLAAELERQTARGEQELSPVLSELGSRLKEITNADPEIQADFDAIGERLKTAGVPHEILKRHQDAVSDYRANLSQLRSNIEGSKRLYDNFRQASGQGHATDAEGRYKELKNKVASMSAHLRHKVKDPAHTAIDPNRLPHRSSDLQRREPRLSAADFSTLSNSSQGLTIKTAQARVLSLAVASSMPGPDDLGETPDVRLTPEIRALAAQLGNDPIRIYDYVRSQIDFVPTYGSIQGATACLSTRLCNDLDTASLLIALLRAAGIPARYALGTIEVPIAKAQNWVGGFTDPNAALHFIASSGTPVVGLTSGGTLVAARLEHVWVEAFVDYIPSRGTVRGTGDTWVPLDASFKQLSYQGGIDVASAAGSFGSVEFFKQLAVKSPNPDGSVTGIDVVTLDQKRSELESQIATYASSQTALVKFDDLVGTKTILPQRLSTLPGSLPYRVLVRGMGFSQVPDLLRHSLEFEVTSNGRSSPDLIYAESLPELAGKRVTLSYVAASSSDEAVLRALLPADLSLGDFPSILPAYLVHVKPELRVEGIVVATGEASTLGEQGQFSLVFHEARGGSLRVDNSITAGTYNAIVLNLGRVGNPSGRYSAVQSRLEGLQSGNIASISKDEVLGEFLHSAGLLYWSELQLSERLTASVTSVKSSRVPSEGIFTCDLKASFLFGVPRAVSRGAFLTDVDTDRQAVFSLDGDPQKAVEYFVVTGVFSSRLESAIYDQVFNNEQLTGKGITAVSYIESAVRQGIPIYRIGRENLGLALPNLQVATAVKSDIENSVNAGKVVVIPQREFFKDGFQGIGYIVLDLETGAGAYLLNSGIAGGGFDPVTNVELGFVLSVSSLLFFSFPGVIAVVSVLNLLLIGYSLLTGILGIYSDPNLPGAAKAGLILINVVLAILGTVFAFAKGQNLQLAASYFPTVLSMVDLLPAPLSSIAKASNNMPPLP